MRKLIFFDIDGTIITEGTRDRIIPDSLPKALHALQADGHLCFVNTGRSFAEVDTVIRDLQFDGYICGCGTYITYQDKVLYSHTIPFPLGNEILASLRECNLEWLLEGTDSIHYSSCSYQTRIGDFKKEHQLLIPEAIHIITPEQENDLTFDKFCICLGENHQFDTFSKRYEKELTFIDRKNNFYEVIPKGHSKASGIAFLEDYFQIPHDDTIAIGDSTNDLPMLEYAAYSIAMGNSAKELFKVVDYVTDSVEEDGIYHAMKHLQLI